MDDILAGMNEVRKVESVVSEMVYQVSTDSIRNVIFTKEHINSVKEGKRFVIGQLVSLVTKDTGGNILTQTPFLISGINNPTGTDTDVEYVGKLLIGSMDTVDDVMLTDTKNGLDKLSSEVNGDILETLLITKLGFTDSLKLKSFLNVPHIYILNGSIFRSFI